MNFAMNHSDMGRASSSLSDAAEDAGDADGSTALDDLMAGIPGSTTAELSVGMKSDWTKGVSGWSDDAKTFADDVSATSKTTESTDDSSGSFLDLFGWMGA